MVAAERAADCTIFSVIDGLAASRAAALKLPAAGWELVDGGASKSEMPAPLVVVPRCSQPGCSVATTK